MLDDSVSPHAPSLSDFRYLQQGPEYRNADLISLSPSENRYVETMGDRVRNLRRSKRLTQPQLAKQIGVGQSTVSEIETGQNTRFSPAVMDALCRELTTTAAFLIHGVTEEQGHEAAMQEAELVAIFRELHPEGQYAVLQSARTVRQSIPRTSAAQPLLDKNPPPNKQATPKSQRDEARSSAEKRH